MKLPELRTGYQSGKFALCFACLFWSIPLARAQGEAPGPQSPPPITWDLPVEALPDLREEKPKVPVPAKRAKNWFLVPVPLSSPTFGTGLVLGGVYFYPQTEADKARQPQSFTAAAGGYTSNKSRAGGVMQQNYWDGDQWRFNAVAGNMDFRLELLQALNRPDQSVLDWRVSGSFLQSSVSRRLGSDWYLGATIRYLDITQELDQVVDAPDYNSAERIVSPGVGISAVYDTRDMPTNAYRGLHLEFRSMLSDQRSLDDGTYVAVSARIRSYHLLRENLVLAWEVSGCQKSGEIPLWDACRLNLRGFPVTDYLSDQSLSGQVEARWQISKRWGAVAFAGAGIVDNPFAGNGRGQTIPSYGAGLRFMVLPSQRINLRVDYGRSNNGAGAWYLAVSEAF